MGVVQVKGSPSESISIWVSPIDPSVKMGVVQLGTVQLGAVQLGELK